MKIFIQVVLFISFWLLVTVGYAETSFTCPSIQTVKQNSYYPTWLPLYISNGELAFDRDVKVFASTVTSFDRAEWSGGFLEAGHCYYRSTTQIAQTIVLARDMLLDRDPLPPPGWQEVEHIRIGRSLLFRCVGSNEDACPFSGIGG